jgi:hypothetical protein
MRPSNVFDCLSAAARFCHLGVEAQNVITLRVMGLAGVWNTPIDESWRMMAEKPKTFIASGNEGAAAILAGKSAEKVVSATLEPLQQAARDNRLRLEDRGFRKL